MAEVINDPNMHARGTLQWIDHPEYGRVVVQHSPIRIDGIPLVPLQPSGRLGEQNADVYQEWLGTSKTEHEQLVNDKVI